jgi:hypothetical protein
MAVPFANAGTPLMWAGVFHLLIGNGIVGVVEAFLLTRFFRAPAPRTYQLVIAGNYLSMFVGVWTLGWLTVRFIDATVTNVFTMVAATCAGYIVFTVVIEFPFVLASLWRQRGRWWKAAVGALAMHTVSYGLLVPYYWSKSGTSLLTQASLQSDMSFATDPNITVFFVGPDRLHVCRTTLDGAEPRRVCELDAASQFARLFLRQSTDGDTCDLWLADQGIAEPRLLARTLARVFQTAAFPQTPIANLMAGWRSVRRSICARGAIRAFALRQASGRSRGWSCTTIRVARRCGLALKRRSFAGTRGVRPCCRAGR